MPIAQPSNTARRTASANDKPSNTMPKKPIIGATSPRKLVRRAGGLARARGTNS